MSNGKWYKDTYKFRTPITLDCSDVGSATHDFQAKIPDDWDYFWDNIRSDFLDVVITDQTSKVVDFQRKDGASYANKILTLELDAVATPNPVTAGGSGTMLQYFLYFGNPDESVDSEGSFTITSVKGAYVELGAAFTRIVTPFNVRPSVNQPQTTFIKTSTEEIDVFYSVASLLSPRTAKYNKRMNFEAIEKVEVRSFDKDGTNDNGRFKLSLTRFMRSVVKVRAKGGSDGTDYALSLLITTTSTQVYDIRCIISVRDLLPD